MTDAVAVCAAGEAAWHAAAHAALGVPWHTDERVAWTDRPSHSFLLGAVTLHPDAVVPDGVSAPVRDSFGTLDLVGWTSEPADPWMIRPPGVAPVVDVPGVTVARTDDALLFERTAFVGAAGVPPRTPGELHPPGSERVPGLTFLLATRDDGTPVGTALSVAGATSVQVSGVAVVPDERRRGIGAALTATAVACAPALPATLASSAMAVRTYERLGFAVVPGRPLQWTCD